MIFDAILFAALAHTGQYRKGSRLPYLIHPLGREDLPVLGEELWARFSRPRADQQRYYRALAGLFTARMTAPPGDRLAGEFAEAVAAVFPVE